MSLSHSWVCRVLLQLDYVRLRPRRWPSKQDAALRAAFRVQLDGLKADPSVELWFGDESGIEGDPTPRAVLAKKGSRPRAAYTGKHIRSNVVGALAWLSGLFVSLVLPFVNHRTFQLFLDELNRVADPAKRVVLALDNASWHKVKSLNWGRIEPLYLPPYSPDFNPIEILWRVLKENFFVWHVATDHDQHDDYVEKALAYYHQHPEECRTIVGGNRQK